MSPILAALAVSALAVSTLALAGRPLAAEPVAPAPVRPPQPVSEADISQAVTYLQNAALACVKAPKSVACTKARQAQAILSAPPLDPTKPGADMDALEAEEAAVKAVTTAYAKVTPPRSVKSGEGPGPPGGLARPGGLAAPADPAKAKSLATGEQKDVDTVAAAQASGHGPGLAGQASPGPGGINFDTYATSDTKTATVRATFNLGGTKTLAIAADTPVGQSANYQNVATLDGLATSTNLGLTYGWLAFVDLRDRIGPVGNSPEFQQACEAELNIFLQTMDVTYEDNNPSEKDHIADLRRHCEPGSTKDMVAADPNLSAREKKVLGDAFDKLNQFLLPDFRSLWMFNLNGKIGYASHTFYDGTTLAKSMQDKYGWQVGGSATYLRATALGNASVTGSLTYQRAYDDGGLKGTTQTLCPATATGVAKCVSGYVGSPLQVEKEQIALEGRWIAPKSFPFSFGLDPGFTYDARSGAYAFSFPVYLITASKGSTSLTGGIRYDWTSDKHESVLGIFVTSAFCIVPGVACGTDSSSSKK